MTEVIYHIGIAQAWFAAILVARKQNKGPADRVLIIWLLVIGIEMLYSILNLKHFTDWPDLIVIPFTYGPFLLLYARYLLANKYVFKSSYLLHFGPFVIFAVVGMMWNGPLEINTINFLDKGVITILGTINFSLFLVSMIMYWVIVLRMVRKHNSNLSDLFSYESSQLRLNWLHLIALWIFGSFLITTCVYSIFAVHNIWPFNPVVIYHIGLLVFIFSVSFFGIHQTVLFPVNEVTEDDVVQPKIIEDNNQGKLLEQYMIVEKPYLDRELTIHALSERCGIEVSEISFYLNQILGKNFFSYINEFRVEEAKQRISNQEHSHLTLLAIGYDSGFNSKSSFNSLFKKYTGSTPSDFRAKSLV